MPKIEAEIRGHDVALLRIRGIEERLRAKIVESLQDTSEKLETMWRDTVPHDTGELAKSVRTSGIIFSPGGLGGGGFWEVEVSVGEGIPYLNIVVEGSGIFGPKRHKIEAAKGTVFAFRDQGEDVFAKSIRGQRPQDEWITAGHELAEGIMREHVAQIDAMRAE